ncbi:MAG: carboxylesterase family protein [Pseudomonadota bacterium]
MRWLILIGGVVLVAWGLLLPPHPPSQAPLRLLPVSSTQRDTRSGPVMGGIAPSGAQAWLGMPYAAPPVGDLRWRAPAAPRGWLNPRQSGRFSSPCPQFASRLALATERPGTLIGAEDCLYLNVFAPAGATSAAGLPVMVFLHGGGNTLGSAASYDPSAFVQEQGVVVVTLNYRLGILGWFRHPALGDERSVAGETSGNFALLDMIAALHWVAANIANFGGDPGRVTLFGQSAGAQNIYGLLASSMAAGLFHGAIIQSGYPGATSTDRTSGPARASAALEANSAEALVDRWLQASVVSQTPSSNAPTPPTGELRRFLRGRSLSALFRGVIRDGSSYRLPRLYRDGEVLPEEPLLEVLGDAGKWNRVPLLIGGNRDEMKLFLALSKRHAVERFGLIPAPREPERYERLARYHTDAWAASGVYEALRAANSGDPTLSLYAYRFDWDSTRKNWFVDLPALLGAAHGLELDFIFRPIFSAQAPGIVYSGNRREFEALGRSLRDYWAGFAYAGRPGSGRSGGQVFWPPWTAGDARVMILDGADDGGVRAGLAEPRLVAELKDDLAAESELPLRLRCALYVDLFLDNSGLPELFDAREYQELGCAAFPSSSVRGLSR